MQNISEIDSLFVCLVCTYIDKIRLILVCSNEVERERERKTKRDLEKINGDRNKGQQLDMGTCPEVDTGQTNMGVSCDDFMY